MPADRYRGDQITSDDVRLGDEAVAQVMQTDIFELLVSDAALADAHRARVEQYRPDDHAVERAATGGRGGLQLRPVGAVEGPGGVGGGAAHGCSFRRGGVGDTSVATRGQVSKPAPGCLAWRVSDPGRR